MNDMIAWIHSIRQIRLDPTTDRIVSTSKVPCIVSVETFDTSSSSRNTTGWMRPSS